MQHGLESDSTSWIANLPEQSAGETSIFLGKVARGEYRKARTLELKKEESLFT